MAFLFGVPRDRACYSNLDLRAPSQELKTDITSIVERSRNYSMTTRAFQHDKITAIPAQRPLSPLIIISRTERIQNTEMTIDDSEGHDPPS